MELEPGPREARGSGSPTLHLPRQLAQGAVSMRCPAHTPTNPPPFSAPISAPPPRLPGSYYGLKPDIKVIAPWREWDLNSRTKLISYAEQHGIAVPAGKRNEPPFSMDANLLHMSYEG